MYYLKEYKCEDQSVILDFIVKNPLGLVCGSFVTGKPVASHLPLMAETNSKGEIIYLIGHLMRGTDHFNAFTENRKVLVVFTGVNHYISASNYEVPNRASTWNYETVHVSGEMAFVDIGALLNILEKTQDYFENNDVSPAGFKNLPSGYIYKHARAIVGFRIKVADIKATFKLSQDKSDEDIKGITDALNKLNTPDAMRMRERIQSANKLKQDK